MRKAVHSMGSLALTIVASMILIFLGIVYFMLTLWMIKVGANWANISVEGNTILLTAGIVSAAAIIGSAIQR